MSCLSIKGTRKGLVICIEGKPLFENIKSELEKRLEIRRGFFRQASFCFEGGDYLEPGQKQALIDMCIDNGMVFDSTVNSALPKNHGKELSYNTPSVSENVVINRNVRSGQKIWAKKDLVVVGNVNPGAELIAGGNIVVMGSLRGVVHAGSEGDITATITAQEMLPSQIRIAGLVACRPDRDGEAPPGQAEIAYIADNKIVVEKHNSHKPLQGTSIIA